MLTQIDQLELMMNSPCRVIFCGRDTFTGHQTPNERILTHRYIRVLRGSLNYTIDESNTFMEAGSIFLVPKNACRYWKVPAGQICEILWIEFDSPDFSPAPHALYAANDGKRSLEKSALLRILSSWRFPRHLRSGLRIDAAMPHSIRLMMAGELKASLGRFWIQALAVDSAPRESRNTEHRVHPEVRKALVWLEENYTRPQVLKEFHEKASISPNHFRKLFQQYAGHSLSFHVRKLRMREAMNLLRSTSLSIKEVANKVGFNDALYFSRRFHQFWDLPPSDLRK